MSDHNKVETGPQKVTFTRIFSQVTAKYANQLLKKASVFKLSIFQRRCLVEERRI